MLAAEERQKTQKNWAQTIEGIAMVNPWDNLDEDISTIREFIEKISLFSEYVGDNRPIQSKNSNFKTNL